MSSRARLAVTALLTLLAFLLAAGPAAALPSDVARVALIGDSITRGYGVPPGAGWADRLEADDPFTDNVLPLAHDGATVRRWNTDYAAELDQLTTWQPAAVVIGLGGNDWYIARSTTQYRADLAQLIAAIRARLPGTRVILWHYYGWAIAPNPAVCDRAPCAPASPPPTWAQYADAARQTAIAATTGYIDNSVTAPDGRPWRTYLSADGAHLTAAGHAQLHLSMRAALTTCC